MHADIFGDGEDFLAWPDKIGNFHGALRGTIYPDTRLNPAMMQDAFQIATSEAVVRPGRLPRE
jgi:hypothetical protein